MDLETLILKELESSPIASSAEQLHKRLHNSTGIEIVENLNKWFKKNRVEIEVRPAIDGNGSTFYKIK
jgi:hypothetical protein